MICLNATTDSNDSAISYSSMSLSSSPVRSSSIQQLLESPLIKSNSQTTSSQNGDKVVEMDTDLEVNDEIIVAESPEMTPVGSQETQVNGDIPLEVANSQSTDDQISSTNSESNTQNNCRNSLRRQTSVCVSNVGPINTNITSSPRALAILKNAIKSGINSNIISDKTTISSTEEVVKNSNELNSVNGFNSPPNSKLFRNSPLSRGSALLRAAKERIKEQEIERSPKISYNQVLNESNYDRRLTGILRKHELSSSPTSGEPKAKKKKVLFAEPVVSSKLEFNTSPSPILSGAVLSFEPIKDLLSSVDKEVEELTTKHNRLLVHQNSTFDKEFDSDSQNSDSPLLFTDESEELEIIIPSCGQPSKETKNLEEELNISNAPTPELTEKEKFESLEVTEEIPNSISSQSSEDTFMCSQVMPDNSLDFNDSPVESSESIAIQTEDPEDDPIVMVPMRLSQLKDLYRLFGSLIQNYSDS